MFILTIVLAGITIFIILFLTLVAILSLSAPPQSVPYEPAELITARVRTQIAQKKYGVAFALALASLHQSPWNWLITEQALYGDLARRVNFEEEMLLDLAREALLGMNAAPFAVERRARFDELTDHWEKLRRMANLLLNGGNPGVTEDEWEILRMDLLKMRLRIMEIGLIPDEAKEDIKEIKAER